MKIVLTDFALSHFDASKHEPAIPCSPSSFEKRINEEAPVLVLPGYAPLCSLRFYNNWTDARLGITKIGVGIIHGIRSEYEARHEGELPVLVRYMVGSRLDPVAKYLCVIVYDKEQMAKEGTVIDGDCAVVNILRLSELVEPPLPPITMMRNALGVSEGGSGVPLNRQKYMESVEFWSKHVAIKPF